MGRRKKTNSTCSRPCGHNVSDEEEMLNDDNKSSSSRHGTPKPWPKHIIPRKKKQRATPETSENVVSEYDEPTPRARAKKAAEQRVNRRCPDPGIYCKKHLNPREYEGFTHIRTLYSQFPKDRCRLICLHMLSTFFIYILVYPLVNFVWSFFINIDDEVLSLSHYITEEPAYLGGWAQHFRRMQWLSWPRFTAESVSLLLATTIKDTVVLQCEGLLDDMSIAELVGGHLSKRYRQ